MENIKIKRLNNFYLIFLICIIIISIVISFRTGSKMYYLVNTNLNDKDTPINSEIAFWKFEVTIQS